MFSDTAFFIAFSLMGLFVLGIASFFIKKMFTNFSKEMLNPKTDTEQLRMMVALEHTKAKANRFVLTTMSVIFACAGVGGLLMSGSEYNKTSEFLEKAERIEGNIVRVEIQSTKFGTEKRSEVVYYPKFTFHTKTGEVVEVLSSTGVSRASYYQPGEAIVVLYDSMNPQDAKIDTFFQLWASTLVFLGVGLAFLLFPLGYSMYRVFLVQKETQLLA